MAGSMGWRGYAKAAGSVLPFRDASVSEEIAIIPDSGIHGGGVSSNAAQYYSEINAAVGQAVIQGDISSAIFDSGPFGTACKNFIDRAINPSNRDAGFTTGANTSLIFSPGGGCEWTLPKSTGENSKCVVKTLSISGNPGDVVTFSAGLVSAGAEFSLTPASAPGYGQADFTYEAAGGDDSNPLPYYASSFTIDDSGEGNITDQITNWSISIENNSQPIFVFNGQNYPADVLQGMMVVTGSFSYYSPNGTFIRNLTHGATLSVYLGNTIGTLYCPFLVFGPYPIPGPGPNAPTIRNVTFRALATKDYGSIYTG